MSDDALTISLLGVYDNSSEPQPLFAHVAAARAAIAVSTVLSVVAVLFRLYTRLVIVKKSGWDDVLLGIHLVFGAVLSILVFQLTKLGWGMHIGKLKVITTVEFRHIFYYATGLYTVATAIIKLSLLFQYLRIPNHGRVYYWLIITAITGVSIWAVVFSILAWYPCTRVSLFWDAGDLGFFSSRQCWFFASPYVKEVRTAYLSHGVTNMILDFVVLVLATPLFWRKDNSARTNRGLLALITMGAFVTGLAIWRVQSIVKNQTGTWPTLDPFFYTPTTIVLSHLEISCASVVASVPVFWPVLLRQISRIIVVEVTEEVRVETRNRESLLDAMAAERAQRGGWLDEGDGGSAARGRRWRGDGRWPGTWVRLASTSTSTRTTMTATTSTTITTKEAAGCGGAGRRPSSSGDCDDVEAAKARPVPPMPVRTRTHMMPGATQQQLDVHRGWRNNSEGGQSVVSHDIYMASITSPLMAPVPPGLPGRNPRSFGPHKPSSFSSASSLRPPPPIGEIRAVSRSHSSDSLGRQQQQQQQPQGQRDMGGSPSEFGPPPPPGLGSVRSPSLLSVGDPGQSPRRKKSRHMALEIPPGR